MYNPVTSIIVTGIMSTKNLADAAHCDGLHRGSARRRRVAGDLAAGEAHARERAAGGHLLVRCRGTASALLLLATALAGCSTYAASRYVASADTGQALRPYRGTRTVTVGPFVATVPNRREMKCREKGTFTTPDGETFEEFVRQTFVSELTKADIYAPGAPVTLTGRLLTIDFSQGVADTSWTFQFELRSSNGQWVTVLERYPIEGGAASSACRETARTLMPAVQHLVAKIVRHPGFPRLLSTTQ